MASTLQNALGNSKGIPAYLKEKGNSVLLLLIQVLSLSIASCKDIAFMPTN